MDIDVFQSLSRIYEHIENDNVEAAIIVCYRLARSKHDYLNAAVFLREVYPSKEEVGRAVYDMASQVNKEAQRFIFQRSLDRWIDLHDIDFLSTGEHGAGEDPTILKVAAGDIDHEIVKYQAMIDDLALPDGMHHADVAYCYHSNIEKKNMYRLFIRALYVVRTRLKVRCLNYATHVESHVGQQRLNQSPIWKIQDNVDSHFEKTSVAIFEKLQKSSVLAASQNSEDCALLLTEVRRTLECVANFYYPASQCDIVCSDGIARQLTADKYLNRLEEFLRTECPATKSTELAQAELNMLAKFMRKLSELASKGVHAEVTQEEAHQGFVGMYLFLSTFIRLVKKQTNKY